MDTPPNNTGPHRLNYMHFRRGAEEEDPSRHELLSKFGPSRDGSMLEYHFYKKENNPALAER
jgi:hypothetical protein